MIFIVQDTDLDIRSNLSVIYFYAPWLLFHKKIVNDLSEIEAAYKKIKFYGIDIDQFKGYVTRFNISSLPTVLITKSEGKVIKNIIGLQAVSSIRSAIHDIYESYTLGD